MRYVVIMAGGAGTRLWPLSRKGTPKQLLKLVGGKSLLRLAFERAAQVVPAEQILVVTGAGYLDQVAADLPEIPRDNLLGEPEGRDSLNACAWPAAVLARRDAQAVAAHITADQIIEPVASFVDALEAGFALAEGDASLLVTLGVVPTSPHTGYGYLHRGAPVDGGAGAHYVAEFREKPDLETAERYVASGEYWWNAGMFVWRAATFLDQLRLLAPVNHDAVLRIVEQPDELAAVFPTLPKNSVDYAIMEPVSVGQGTARVAAVPLPIRWQDVGGYATLAEIVPEREGGNRGEGRVLALEASGNLVVDRLGGDRLVALLGVDDLIVVETPEVTLVARADQAEKIKALVGQVTAQAPHFA